MIVSKRSVLVTDKCREEDTEILDEVQLVNNAASIVTDNVSITGNCTFTSSKQFVGVLGTNDEFNRFAKAVLRSIV